MTAPGRAGAGSGDQRSPLVRLLLRPVHRDRQPRRTGPARRWLLAQLGRDPERSGQAVACRQCSATGRVELLRLSPRRARYWCRRCGAVVTETDLAGLRPPPEPPPAAPAASIQQVIPAAMLRWATARSRRPPALDRLDRATIYQLYQGWDAYLAQLPPAELAALARPGEGEPGEGEPPPVPGLPAFSTVVGALHDRCYRSELVCQALAGDRPDRWPAVWQRVEHARCWLAGRADQLCWIATRVPASGPAVPDRGEVAVAAAALAAGTEPDPAAARAARAALFGTEGGPALRTLRSVYPAPELAAAAREYLATGARPLRADVLARLSAPPEPPPEPLPEPPPEPPPAPAPGRAGR